MALAIFDLDNTLIDRAAAFGRWAAGFAATRALDPAELAWLEAADGDGYVPRPEFVAAVKERYGIVEDLLEGFRAEIVRQTELDPAVPPRLDALRNAGWKVAVATNGSTAQQLAKIDRVGLRAHVDAIAVSEEVGAAKPDRRLFAVAAERCGATLEDGGWMLGDCPTRDIGGGQAAGLHTVWLARGRPWPGGNPPDHTADGIVAAIAALPA